MKTIGVIPARYGSSRYPGKPLVSIQGKPLVIWVAELTARALGRENVVVATENEKIVAAVESYGFHAVMTDDTALTGTDRIGQAAKKIPADIYVNVQGDEPLLNPDDINRIVEIKKQYLNEVVNGMCRLSADEDPANVNIPKVITNEAGRLIYISRSPIPGSKSAPLPPGGYWKQVCIYAYHKQELERFCAFNRKSTVEKIEDIEILRFFELGIPVRMVETAGSSYAVDVPGDVAIVAAALSRRLSGGH